MLSLTRVCAISALLVAGLSTTEAVEYNVDASHSAVIWGIQHLGLGHTYGRFNDLSGTITYDANDLAGSGVNITVQTASIDSANKKRDDHLRNADFFDAGTYPTITFAGTGFTPVEGKADTYSLTGTLTMHGHSEAITVEVVKLGEGAHPMADNAPAIGFETTFVIDRNVFGVGQGKVSGAVGSNVKMIVALEGIAAK